jgi:hypothetical protein
MEEASYMLLTAKITYLMVMHLKYGSKLSKMNIMVNFVIIIIYQCLWILIRKIVLDFIIAVYKNKDLADSIKNILQTFPDFVEIRLWDEGIAINTKLFY